MVEIFKSNILILLFTTSIISYLLEKIIKIKYFKNVRDFLIGSIIKIILFSILYILFFKS